jgi:hypothetical protein
MLGYLNVLKMNVYYCIKKYQKIIKSWFFIMWPFNKLHYYHYIIFKFHWNYKSLIHTMPNTMRGGGPQSISNLRYFSRWKKMWRVIALLTFYGLLIVCKLTNKVFKRCMHIILLKNTNWSNLDETLSKKLCFQTQMSSIVDIYFSSNNISTTPPIYHWFSCFGLQDFHFCFLIFMWLLVVHIFITFQLDILDNIFEPFKWINTQTMWFHAFQCKIHMSPKEMAKNNCSFTTMNPTLCLLY